jgi:hypothetical protein
MDLQFVNRRLLEAAGSLPAWTAYEAAARATMGLAPGPATTGAPADLSELDRRQLVAAVSAVYGADGVTVEGFFTGETDVETDEVRQMPIEWWDVVDGAGSPVYQLWLCHMDCGTLGEFNRSSQHLDDGGVRWAGTRGWTGCPKGRGGSGRRTGRCGRRCGLRVGLSPRALCSGSFGA